jgi:alpha-mannosidase
VLTVFKDGTYGCSVENGKMYITLLNGSVYCAHPVAELPIIDEERFNYYLDTGRHEFSFRLGVCKEDELERRATEFIQKPYALNAYPHGKGEKQENSPVTVSDNNIVVTSFRMVAPDCYMLRLINNYKEGKSCDCRVLDKSLSLSFGKYEVKTLIYKNGELTESDSMLEL